MARPVRKFTDKEKNKIKLLAGYGLTHDEIAKTFDCSDETLRKHCSKELALGKIAAKTLVIGQLFGNIKKGDPASIFFYLKCQAHWKETSVVEHENLVDYRQKVIPLDDK